MIPNGSGPGGQSIACNVLLTEMDLKSEWFEWVKRKTHPWFTSNPQPGKDWIVSQFEGMQCYERVKYIYDNRGRLFRSRETFICEMHKATFRDFELESERLRRKP